MADEVYNGVYDGDDAAALRPVSWAEAKSHLRLDSDADQAYVESLIDAATDLAEERLAATLMARSRTETVHDGRRTIPLPRGPLMSVTSVTDADGAAVTEYELSRIGYLDQLTVTQGYTAPLTVVYQAGYASAAAIPASIRHAILCHVGTLYENRESVTDRARTPVPHSLEDFYRLKSRKVAVG